MTAYADYAFYTDEFHGSVIPAVEFQRYAEKATTYIDGVTFGRIGSDVPDAVKRACCEVAEVYYSVSGKAASAALSNIQSEKIGDCSVSYATPNSETVKIPDKKLYDAAKLWLGGTGLMYRGGNA